jgi:IS30 family transposase
VKGSWVLTEAQKRELIRRYKAGEPVRDIAAHFGVSKNSISTAAIRRGLRRDATHTKPRAADPARRT